MAWGLHGKIHGNRWEPAWESPRRLFSCGGFPGAGPDSGWEWPSESPVQGDFGWNPGSFGENLKKSWPSMGGGGNGWGGLRLHHILCRGFVRWVDLG